VFCLGQGFFHDKNSDKDTIECLKDAIRMRHGTRLLNNVQFCVVLMEIYGSMYWYFGDQIDKIYKTFYDAKQHQKQTMDKIEKARLECGPGQSFFRKVCLSKLKPMKAAMTAVRSYQLQSSSDSIKQIQKLFELCQGDSSKVPCTSDIPSTEELQTLSNDGLSFMIIYLIDMILDLHIIKENLSSSEKKKRSYVWLKTKPCGVRTCMLCGMEGNMCSDHIFSGNCSRNFAKLVQECLSEWPERPSNVFLNWLYVSMYNDVPQFQVLMHLKAKARALEHAVAKA
jgi:hypothetical protein